MEIMIQDDLSAATILKKTMRLHSVKQSRSSGMKIKTGPKGKICLKGNNGPNRNNPGNLSAGMTVTAGRKITMVTAITGRVIAADDFNA